MKSDQQLTLLHEALSFAQKAVAGAATELEERCFRNSNSTKPDGNAGSRLRAAQQTVEEIEAMIALREAKLPGRKVH